MIQKSWRSSIIRDKPGRTIIKRVEADVVLQRVNQVPELALEAACFTGGAEVAFEHVELHSRTVTRQERRHVLAAAIIGYVVREYVSHRDRPDARLHDAPTATRRGHAQAAVGVITLRA
jgi:hypothetical protein